MILVFLLTFPDFRQPVTETVCDEDSAAEVEQERQEDAPPGHPVVAGIVGVQNRHLGTEEERQGAEKGAQDHGQSGADDLGVERSHFLFKSSRVGVDCFPARRSVFSKRFCRAAYHCGFYG